MSRQPYREAQMPVGPPAADGGWRRPFFAQFLQSHLFVQIMMAVGLVAVAVLCAWITTPAMLTGRAAFAWIVTREYDVDRGVALLLRWADDRGGWRSALDSLIGANLKRVRSLVAVPEDVITALEPVDMEKQTVRLGGSGENWSWPVEGAVLRGFGWSEAMGGTHLGVDMLSPVGSPVHAMADGVVLRIYADPLLGTAVEVKHGHLVARYGQVGAVLVQIDQAVHRGQRIASVGFPAGSERQMNPHLHFEALTLDGVEVDPAYHLPRGRKL